MSSGKMVVAVPGSGRYAQIAFVAAGDSDAAKLDLNQDNLLEIGDKPSGYDDGAWRAKLQIYYDRGARGESIDAAFDRFDYMEVGFSFFFGLDMEKLADQVTFFRLISLGFGFAGGIPDGPPWLTLPFVELSTYSARNSGESLVDRASLPRFTSITCVETEGANTPLTKVSVITKQGAKIVFLIDVSKKKAAVYPLEGDSPWPASILTLK